MAVVVPNGHQVKPCTKKQEPTVNTNPSNSSVSSDNSSNNTTPGGGLAGSAIALSTSASVMVTTLFMTAIALL